MKTIKIKINNEEKDIDLLNDFLFGKLLGERGCEEETLHLIKTFTEKNFKSLIYEPNEIKGEHKGNKKSITDVLVMMNDGSIVNIEAQKAKQKKFHKRSHFYNSRIYSILLRVGENHETLPMTFMINIIDFNLHDLEEYHTIFTLCEKTHKEYVMADIMEIHYIDITKFREKVKKGKIDLNNPKDRITLLFDVESPQNLIDEVIKMDSFGNEIYNKTLRILQDKREYLAYIRAEQTELDRKGQIRYATEKGMLEGIEKGMLEGIEKGRLKGIEENKLEIAIKLKKEGFPLEIISKITGISLLKVKKL